MGLQATFYNQKRQPIAFNANADWPGPDLANVYRAKTAAEFVQGVRQLVVNGKLSPSKGEHRSYKAGGAVYFVNGAVRSVYNGHVEGPAADFIQDAAYGKPVVREEETGFPMLAKAAAVALFGFVVGRASK